MPDALILFTCNRFPAGPARLTERSCTALRRKAERAQARRTRYGSMATTKPLTSPCPGCPGVRELARIQGLEPGGIDTSQCVPPRKFTSNVRRAARHKRNDAMGLGREE